MVESLRAIKTDEEPWDKMPSYMKMMRNLNGLLGECKTRLINEIKDNYNIAFDELEQYAKEVKVAREKFAKRDITISLKTNTSNFYALQANADTRSFYEDEMRKINQAIPVPPTPPTLQLVVVVVRRTSLLSQNLVYARLFISVRIPLNLCEQRLMLICTWLV